MEFLRFWAARAWQNWASERGGALGALLAGTLLMLLTAFCGAAVLQLHAAAFEQNNPREIVVFFAPDATQTQIEAARNAAKKADETARETQFLGAEQVLARVQNELGADDAQLLTDLAANNPLGAEVRWRASNRENAQTLSELLARQEGVARVEKLGSAALAAQISRLSDAFLMGLGVLAPLSAWGIGALAGFGASFSLIFRREELRAMNWSGATLGFLRAPFVLQGAFFGALCAALGTLFLALAHAALAFWNADFARQLLPLELWKVAIWVGFPLFVSGTLSAVVGAWLAFQKRRGSLNPEV